MNEATVSGRNRTLLITLAVVVLVAAVATGAFVLGTSRSASGHAAVSLTPKDQTGDDPFTASVQIGQATAFAANVQAVAASSTKALPVDPATGTKRATGTAPGLYGGSGNAKVCDPQKIVDYLDDHPDKAAAWAGVLGIEPASVKAYVAQLTPVVLTSDTLVTNHGFRAGHATTLPSVLQAGTAVMVDSTGTPRVKCNCGNPLTPPGPISLEQAAIRGTPWAGYTTHAVTTVAPGATATALELLDIHTGRTYAQPVGSGLDGTWIIRLTGPTGCGLGALDDGPRLVIDGGSATLEPAAGDTYRGTVKAGPPTKVQLALPQNPHDQVTLTGRQIGETISGASFDGGVLGGGQTGWACENTFVATRQSGTTPGTSPPTTAPRTTTSTTAAPTTTSASGVAALPVGLKCKDLVARGLTYDDAYEYWNLHGHPPLMDADSNGVPCETVYPASVVAAYLHAHGLGAPTPTAPAPTTPAAGPCTTAAIQQALVAEGSTTKVFGPPICSGPWAAAAVTFEPTGDEGTSFWHWNDSAWVRGDCAAPGVPEVVHYPGCEVS